jgi:hypothetical protein
VPASGGGNLSTDDSVPRRNFLIASGVLSGLWAAGAPLGLVAPARASPPGWKILTNAQSTTLMSVARTIAPHDGLSDAAYASVVRAIDEAAAANAHTREALTSGLQLLGNDFASRSEAERVRSLKAMEHSEFFQLARTNTLGNLYSSPLAYAHFGYEGEAFSKGGYLLRGFNDLKWLPDVPLGDSGPPIARAEGSALESSSG